ncbi:MAG: hypothetical protein R3C61_29155 [Bacteroidia bacterium]
MGHGQLFAFKNDPVFDQGFVEVKYFLSVFAAPGVKLFDGVVERKSIEVIEFFLVEGLERIFELLSEGKIMVFICTVGQRKKGSVIEMDERRIFDRERNRFVGGFLV